MRKITCLLLLIQAGFMMAQTKTVVTQNGEKIAISPYANNGLTANNGYIQLGGPLTQPSVLTTTSAFTLAITGLQAGTASDNVLVSDANGVLKYVARSGFGGADNLGNHIATQNLMMNKNDVVFADRKTANTNVFSLYKDNGFFGIWNNSKSSNALVIDETTNKTTLQSAQITKGIDGVSPTAGYVAVSADTNGNINWVSASSLGTGDNLGNHTATTDLAMSGKNINNAANITATGKTTTNTAQITKGTNGLAPQAGYIATAADNNGNVVWVAPTPPPAASDATRFLGGSVYCMIKQGTTGGTLSNDRVIGKANGVTYKVGTNITAQSSKGSIVSVKGSGYTISNPSDGIYDIKFDTTLTEIYGISVNILDANPTLSSNTPDMNAVGLILDTRDNAQVAFISNSFIRIKTGNSAGVNNSRSFTFLVTGQ